MTESLFESTGHALATAYVILENPPQGETALRRALVQILKNIHRPTEAQTAWLNQLQGVREAGEPASAVNFSGLTAEEVRAQCAMIAQAVTAHLPAPERAAVISAYTMNRLEKVRAVRELSEYIKPAADAKQRMLYDYCVLRSLPRTEQNKEAIAKLRQTGITEKSAAAYFRETKKKVQALRKRGENRLEIIFIRNGVINDKT
jgi:hypothetical protein